MPSQRVVIIFERPAQIGSALDTLQDGLDSLQREPRIVPARTFPSPPFDDEAFDDEALVLGGKPPVQCFYSVAVPAEKTAELFAFLRTRLADLNLSQAYVPGGARLAAWPGLSLSSLEDIPSGGGGIGGGPGPAYRLVPPPLWQATRDFTKDQGWYTDLTSGALGNVWLGHPPTNGNGENVQIADIEADIPFPEHEALPAGTTGTIQSLLSPPFTVDELANRLDARCHATAVAGIIAGNGSIRGIAPSVKQLYVSRVPLSSPGSNRSVSIAPALLHAATTFLHEGDVVLIEIERQGPPAPFSYGLHLRPPSLEPPSLEDIPSLGEPPSLEDIPSGRVLRWLPAEYLPEDRETIYQLSNKLGLIVIEAAGNGGANLDDSVFDYPPPVQWGYEYYLMAKTANWHNPFRPGNESGAILVGAGAPPPGYGGRDWGPYRSRLHFSNYGTRVDVQGWGAGIISAGYGDLQGGVDPRLWYTARFNGTSGAAAMVAGIAASVQSAHKIANGGVPMTSDEVRKYFQSTKNIAPQTGDLTKHIGSLAVWGP